MAAPFTPTVTVQAGFGYQPADDLITWTDITGTYNPRDLEITRGRSDELSNFSPGACSLELVDTTARNLDPTNTSGAYVETITTQLYPVPGAAVTEVGTSLGTDNAQTLPSSILTGDLLLAFVTIDDPGATGLSTGAGSAAWTELFDKADTTGPNTVRMACYARIATGSDTLTLSGDVDDYVVAIFRVVRHGCSTTADITVGTAANSNVGTADPPLITPAGGSGKYLWIACAGFDETIGSTLGNPPAGPGTWTTLQNIEDGNDRVGMMIAYRQAEASSMDPTTFGSTLTGTWIANTLAIPPLSSSETVTQVVPGVPLRVVASLSTATTVFSDTAAGPDVDTRWRVTAGAVTAAIAGAYTLPISTTLEGPAFNFDTDASFQFGTAADGASPNHDVRIVLANGGYIGWNLTGTTLTYAVNDGGSTADDTVAWSDANHRYLRIRFSGSSIVWERSADASSWTTIATYTRGVDFSSTVDWSYGYLLVRNNAAAGSTPQLDDFLVKVTRLTLFTGSVESWDYQPLGGNQGALVRVDALDAFSDFANRELRSAWADEMIALAPSGWWRLAEVDGTIAHDSSGHERHGTIPEGVVAPNQAPILPKIGPRATRFFRTPTTAIVLPDSARMSQLPHSVNLWVQASQPFSQLGLNTAGNQGSMMFIAHAQLNADGNTFYMYLQPTIDSTVSTNPVITGWRIIVADLISTGAVIAAYPATIDDGLPHMITWIMSSTGTTALYLDGVLTSANESFAGVSANILGTTIGNGYIAPATNGGFSFIGLMQEVAFFDGYHVNATDIANLYAAATAPWEGDTTGARIHRVLDLIGWPAELRRIDPGTTTMLAANPEGQSVLAHLQEVEATEGGRLFIGPHGEVVFHDQVTCSQRGSGPVLYDDATSGVNILGDGFRVTNDTQYLYTKASVAAPAGQQDYTDTTKAARYGTRAWSGQVSTRTGQEAYLRGVRMVERYKVPRPRVGAWRVAPEKRPADWASILWQRLGDTARLQFQLLDTGLSYDAYVDVSMMRHRVADGAWLVDMIGTPQDPGIGSYLEWDASGDLGWEYGEWR